jgi:hypothetical protein
MFFVIVASVGLKIVSYEGTKRDHPLDSLVHLGRTTYRLKNTVKRVCHHESSSSSLPVSRTVVIKAIIFFTLNITRDRDYQPRPLADPQTCSHSCAPRWQMAERNENLSLNHPSPLWFCTGSFQRSARNITQQQ